jgi:hypothetical protein
MPRLHPMYESILRTFVTHSTLHTQQPPPDDPEYVSQSTSKKAARPWFPSYRSEETSYQSGGVPTFNNSMSGGASESQEVESQQNQWETRLGLRVDMLAAFAYLIGPLSGEYHHYYVSHY